MHNLHAARSVWFYTLSMVSLLVAFASGVGQAAAAVPGPCAAGMVQHSWQVRPVRFMGRSPVAQSQSGDVIVTWQGHSSFLLTSPQGMRLLTDPNGYHPVTSSLHAVTVSNLHPTHADVGSVPQTPSVLWGIKPDGGWNPITRSIEDVTLFNIPSYASRTDPENSPIQNSIFVFHMGGLCIVHLGNLRHPLTPSQLQRLGQPDVVMIPVEGQWNLAYDDVITVITQLQPRLVLPMHIDFPEHAERFVTYTAGRYPVRRLAGRTLVLNRGALPAATEIVLFGSL